MGFLFNPHKNNLNSSSTQQQSTSNQAYGDVGQNLIGQSAAGSNATNILSSLLSGGAQGQQAFQNYQNSTGYQNQLDSMSRAITGNRAASGLLRSGGTGTALQTQGNQLANQSFNNYLSQLLGLAGLGNQSAGLLGSIAPTSQQGSSTGTQQTLSPSLFSSLLGGVSTLFPNGLSGGSGR